MKKLFSLLVVLLLVCSVAGCKEKETGTGKKERKSEKTERATERKIACKEG